MNTRQNHEEVPLDLGAAREYFISSINYPIRSDEHIEKFLTQRSIIHPTWGEILFDKNGSRIIYKNPSINRIVHSWLFMNDFFHQINQNELYLDGIGQFVTTWCDENLYMSIESELFPIIYHDETTAQRMNQALRLHSIFQSHGFEKITRRLESLIEATAILLGKESFYAGNNNHGMFQAKALRDYASYATWVDDEVRMRHLSLSLERITEYFMHCFTSEGVHIEHSPSYHLMVSRHVGEHISFMSKISTQKPNSLIKILEMAELHAIHSVQPDGRFLPLSDTVQSSLRGTKNNVFESPEFTYATTQGKQGLIPHKRTLSEPISGYLFHRTSWRDSNAGYLAFIAAYNGGYHKHSDDLHVYLYKYGIEILSESGPYGYGMSNPLVRYGFSQYSHNNIVVDSRSLPRHDGRLSAVAMTKLLELPGKRFRISASNARFDNVRHDREILFDDGLNDICVVDNLTSTTNHNYSLIWNFGPYLDIRVQDHEIFGLLNGQPLIRMTFDGAQIEKITCTNGRGGNRPSGWRFPAFGKQVASQQVSIDFAATNTRIITKLKIYKPSAEVIDGIKKVSLRSNDQIRNEVSTSSKSVRSEPTFAALFVDQRTIRIKSSDPSARGVIRLYRGKDMVSEQRGFMKKISWANMETGKYRARIFPKGKFSSIPPYTTDWLQVP